MKEKRTIFQRVLAFMLSLVMVFGLIVTPDFAAVVHASGMGGEEEPAPQAAAKTYTVSLSMKEQGTYYVGNTYGISASATDENGTPLQGGAWSASSVGAEVKEDSTNGGFTFSASSAGAYTITAQYQDENGSGEQSISISVAEKPTVTVTGKVVDAYKNLSISDANVVFDNNNGSKVETTTGDNGVFSATLIQNESYTMTVSKDGYGSYTGNPKAYTTGTTEADVVLTTNQKPILSAPGSITYNDKTQQVTLEGPDGWGIENVSSDATSILEATKNGDRSVNLTPIGIGSSTVTVTAHGVSSSVAIQVVQDTVVPKLQITKDSTAISETNKVYPKDKISAKLTLQSKVDNNVSVKEGNVVMSLMKKGTSGVY